MQEMASDSQMVWLPLDSHDAALSRMNLKMLLHWLTLNSQQWAGRGTNLSTYNPMVHLHNLLTVKGGLY